MNKGICPVLDLPFDHSDMTVDHAHTRNAINLGKKEEAGLIRGIINKHANALEGKITNAFIRYGLHKQNVDLPDVLRKLADYIENPPLVHLKYIHPSEKPKDLILKKNSIKKVIKAWEKKYPNRKLPDILLYKQFKKGKKKGEDRPKKLTSGLEKLYNEFEITPEFLKK